eukprot:scaffold15078_cov51-Phaeocystis_antarctica.AAC.2
MTRRRPARPPGAAHARRGVRPPKRIVRGRSTEGHDGVRLRLVGGKGAPGSVATILSAAILSAAILSAAILSTAVLSAAILTTAILPKWLPSDIVDDAQVDIGLFGRAPPVYASGVRWQGPLPPHFGVLPRCAIEKAMCLFGLPCRDLGAIWSVTTRDGDHPLRLQQGLPGAGRAPATEQGGQQQHHQPTAARPGWRSRGAICCASGEEGGRRGESGGAWADCFGGKLGLDDCLGGSSGGDILGESGGGGGGGATRLHVTVFAGHELPSVEKHVRTVPATDMHGPEPVVQPSQSPVPP